MQQFFDLDFDRTRMPWACDRSYGLTRRPVDGGIHDTKIRFTGWISAKLLQEKLARNNKNANNIFISQEIHIQESRI